MNPRILIVSELPQFRRRLADLLAEKGCEVVGTAEDIEAAQDLVASKHPDVAVVELHGASGRGIELVHGLRRADGEVESPVLSPREREIMALLAGGLTGEQIAQRLFISPETVRTHVRNAMEKLGAHTRTHAIVLALTSGEISAG